MDKVGLFPLSFAHKQLLAQHCGFNDIFSLFLGLPHFCQVL
jgi:hypothetical protein